MSQGTCLGHMRIVFRHSVSPFVYFPYNGNSSATPGRCFVENSQPNDKDVYSNVMTVNIIVIILACSFIDVLADVIVLMHKYSCAPLLGSWGRRALAGGDLVGSVEIA